MANARKKAPTRCRSLSSMFLRVFGIPGLQICLKETTGGEFRVFRASTKLLWYIELLYGSYNGNYPPENVLDLWYSRVL